MHHLVMRGGSWNNNARNCRAANRNRNAPDNQNNNNGFRVAAVPASTLRIAGVGERDFDKRAEESPECIPVMWATASENKINRVTW